MSVKETKQKDIGGMEGRRKKRREKEVGRNEMNIVWAKSERDARRYANGYRVGRD